MPQEPIATCQQLLGSCPYALTLQCAESIGVTVIICSKSFIGLGVKACPRAVITAQLYHSSVLEREGLTYTEMQHP